MKKLILIFLLSIPSFLFSQENVLLKHENYISLFSKTKHYPVYVEWWLTREKTRCTNPLQRNKFFKPDPLLYNETNLNNSYLRSGYDRGHMCPAADNLCQGQKIQDECFYFSNAVPQTHSLNAGDWNSLEMQTRKISAQIDSIHIWAGNIGEIAKIGKVSVPQYCWKVLYYKKSNTYKAYLFKNDNSKPNGIRDNEVNIEKITELTVFNFQ